MVEIRTTKYGDYNLENSWVKYPTIKDAIRILAYMRFAYHNHTTVILKDGYIVSSLELSEYARFIFPE